MKLLTHVRRWERIVSHYSNKRFKFKIVLMGVTEGIIFSHHHKVKYCKLKHWQAVAHHQSILPLRKNLDSLKKQHNEDKHSIWNIAGWCLFILLLIVKQTTVTTCIHAQTCARAHTPIHTYNELILWHHRSSIDWSQKLSLARSYVTKHWELIDTFPSGRNTQKAKETCKVLEVLET